MADQITSSTQVFVKQREDDENWTKGSIEAYVTTFGNGDVVNDVIDKNALDEFVKNFDGALPMYWQHNTDELIGEWKEFEIDEYGVKGYGQLFIDEVQRAEETYKLLKAGKLDSVSIGFRATDYERKEDGGYLFKEIFLMEVSVVVRPANQQAKVTSVKNNDGSVNLRQLEEILRDAGLSRKVAKTVISSCKESLETRCDAEEVQEQKQEGLAGEILALIK